MTSFRSPWMDWKSKKEYGSAVSTVSSMEGQKGKNLTPDEGSVSTVSSLDKQKRKIFGGGKSAVSSVSASDKDLSEKKKDLKMLFYRTDSTDTTQKNLNLTIQRTDSTDSTPRILDGHMVARIIWKTEKAVLFTDDLGRAWRFLHAYGKAWPFVVS
jgi:hypothetical protein